MQKVVNELIIFAIRQSPHRRIKIESAWEKQHLAWEKKHLSKQEQMDAAERKMRSSEIDIPTLQGWFLKEKHESFKRRQGLLPGYSCNRRWFTIERATKSVDDESSEELLLCYYKLASAEKDQRCGWLFLNDITSLSQDLPNRWITIEHPTRVIRIQSPTPAQHRVWFYTLSKCCKNAKKSTASPFPSSVTGDRPPSLPYFSEITTQKMRRNSLRYADLPVAGTPKDELEFLREITGGVKTEVEEVRRNMNLFCGASFSTYAEDAGMIDRKDDGEKNSEEVVATLPGGTKKDEPVSLKSYSPSDSSSRSGTSGTSSIDHLDQIVRLSSVMKSATLSPELAKSTEVSCTHENEATEVTSFHANDGASWLTKASDRKPDLKDLKQSLSMGDNRQGLQVSSAVAMNMPHETFPTTLLGHEYKQKKIHLSKSTERIAKSSTYQEHFGNEDDDKILPDDDFLHNDWDA